MNILVFLAAFAILVSSLVGISALTTGCINRDSWPSFSNFFCCSGDIEISSEVSEISYGAFTDSNTCHGQDEYRTSFCTHLFSYANPCSITSVVFPNSVTSIEPYAFLNNKIAKVNFGNSISADIFHRVEGIF